MRTVLTSLSPLWDEVMTRAGYRCEATTTTRRVTTRCDHEHPQQVLVVAPRDPAVPEHATWRIPTADQAVWCSPCLTEARRKAVARRRRPRVCTGQEDLLALVSGPENGSGMSDLSGTTSTVTSEREGVVDGE